jgi:hypothetical protein
MESIELFNSCWLPFDLIVEEYLYSIQFLIMTEQCNESECLHNCTVTSHVGMTGVMQQFVYRESECLYISAVTRHAKVKGKEHQFVCQLSCSMRTATQTDDWWLKLTWIIFAALKPQPITLNGLLLFSSFQLVLLFTSVHLALPN